MSSTTTTSATMGRRTYWCHECDMSISLTPPIAATDIFTCPTCNSDFLEELDSPITFTNHNIDNDYFNLINQLFNSNPIPNPNLNPNPSGQNSPASKSAIEGIPTVKITAGLLEVDPDIMCAVCKDQFLIDDDTKQLPCKHMYHPDCILPWLSQRNSCPVCRFQLPVDPSVDGEFKVRRRSRSRILRFGDFMDHESESDSGNGNEELVGFGLRNLARRGRFVFPISRNQFRVEGEETQIGEEGGVSGRTESVETVSSWPNWQVDIADHDLDVAMSS